MGSRTCKNEDSAVIFEDGGDCDGCGCGSTAGGEPRDCGDWPGAASTAGASGIAVADGGSATRSVAEEAESGRCGVSHCAADQCGRAHGCGDGGHRALHDEGCETRAGNCGQAGPVEPGASRRRGGDAEGDRHATGAGGAVSRGTVHCHGRRRMAPGRDRDSGVADCGQDGQAGDCDCPRERGRISRNRAWVGTFHLRVSSAGCD